MNKGKDYYMNLFKIIVFYNKSRYYLVIEDLKN